MSRSSGRSRVAPARSIEFSRRAARFLDTADPQVRERCRTAVLELANNPLLGKKLKGEFERLRSFRLGTFRIIFIFSKDLLEIVHIDHRRDVYR